MGDSGIVGVDYRVERVRLFLGLFLVRVARIRINFLIVLIVKGLEKSLGVFFLGLFVAKLQLNEGLIELLSCLLVFLVLGEPDRVVDIHLC